MNRLRSKLTYSNVMVTVLAVLVIGGGTAYAASEMLPKNSVGSKQIKKEAVTPSKLSKASKAALTGPSGAVGATGPQGKEGKEGSPGEQGEEGAPGTALAYATILNGQVSEFSGSFNLTNANVTNPATGIYCLSGLPAGTNAVIAGSANLGTGENDIIVSASYDTRTPPSLDGCPGAEARVRTFDVSAAALANATFNVWFEG
jgi:hypothetical protein